VIEDFLKDQSAEGRFDSAGVFTKEARVDFDRYAGILAQEPAYHLLRMAQLAHLCRAESVHVEVSTGSHSFRCDPQDTSEIGYFFDTLDGKSEVGILLQSVVGSLIGEKGGVLRLHFRAGGVEKWLIFEKGRMRQRQTNTTAASAQLSMEFKSRKSWLTEFFRSRAGVIRGRLTERLRFHPCAQWINRKRQVYGAETQPGVAVAMARLAPKNTLGHFAVAPPGIFHPRKVLFGRRSAKVVISGSGGTYILEVPDHPGDCKINEESKYWMPFTRAHKPRTDRIWLGTEMEQGDGHLESSLRLLYLDEPIDGFRLPPRAYTGVLEEHRALGPFINLSEVPAMAADLLAFAGLRIGRRQTILVPVRNGVTLGKVVIPSTPPYSLVMECGPSISTDAFGLRVVENDAFKEASRLAMAWVQSCMIKANSG
jgi:hypothetical protein